jgi:hypothetical protein
VNGDGNEAAFTMRLALDDDWTASVTGDPLHSTPRFAGVCHGSRQSVLRSISTGKGAAALTTPVKTSPSR